MGNLPQIGGRVVLHYNGIYLLIWGRASRDNVIINVLRQINLLFFHDYTVLNKYQPLCTLHFSKAKNDYRTKKRHCYNYVLIYIVKGLEPYKGMATSSGRSRTKLSAFRVFLFQCNYKKEPFNCTVTGYKMGYVFSKWLITFMFKTLQLVQWIPHTHTLK